MFDARLIKSYLITSREKLATHYRKKEN